MSHALRCHALLSFVQLLQSLQIQSENYKGFFFCNDPCNVVLQRSAIGETFYFKIVVIATQQFMVITSKIPALQSSSR